MSFEEELTKGHNTEILIENILQRYNWWTIPTYDYKGENKKSPRLMNNGNHYILPDLDISKNGNRLWVECKHELGADWTVKTQRYEHGFAKKYYEDYLEIEKITGVDVWVFFFELSQYQKDENFNREENRYKIPKWCISEQPDKILRGQLLKNLTIRMSHMNRRPYVYFPQNEFLVFGIVTDDCFLKHVTIKGGNSILFKQWGQ